MSNITEQARAFLAEPRLAVAGVSRTENGAANGIYRKLKETGHEVFAINPNATEVEGDPSYPDLQSIPGGVGGVVTVTTPEVTEQIVWQCIRAGVPRVWMHRSLGDSVSDAAVRLCEENGIDVIAGGCPMMFQEPIDFGHKCLKWWFQRTGRVPR